MGKFRFYSMDVSRWPSFWFAWDRWSDSCLQSQCSYSSAALHSLEERRECKFSTHDIRWEGKGKLWVGRRERGNPGSGIGSRLCHHQDKNLNTLTTACILESAVFQKCHQEPQVQGKNVRETQRATPVPSCFTLSPYNSIKGTSGAASGFLTNLLRCHLRATKNNDIMLCPDL